MGVNNATDQRVPVLDAWVSLPLYDSLVTTNGQSNGLEGGASSLDGYSISCYPSHQLIGCTTNIMRGRNLYAQLITAIRQTVLLRGHSDAECRMFIDKDDRDRWQVTIGIASSTITSLKVSFDGTINPTTVSWANPRWLGFESLQDQPLEIVFEDTDHPLGGQGMYATTVYGPVGTWQPEHMGWTTLSDRTMNYRVTKSPYNSRTESRLFWGVNDMKTLRYEMVHAAALWRDRNADIPCEGWAAAAHMEKVSGTTAERVMPWWAQARPQRAERSSIIEEILWHKDGAEEDTIFFDPSDLNPLIWLDPNDWGTMFTDLAETTPVSAIDDSIAVWKNKGSAGAAGDFSMVTSAARPILGIGGVKFDATKSLEASALLPLMPFTIVALVDGLAADSGGRFLGAGPTFYMSRAGDFETRLKAFQLTTTPPRQLQVGTLTEKLFAVRAVQSSLRITTPGGNWQNAATAVNGSTAPMSIGQLFTGQSGNVFVFDRVLSDGELEQLFRWYDTQL